MEQSKPLEPYDVTVSNLLRETKVAELRELFSQIDGPIVDVQVIKRTQNRSTARITFGNERTRQAAVARMDRLKVNGRPIRMEYNDDNNCCKDCRQEERWWTLEFDGASRGNPGEGGAGAVLYCPHGKLDEVRCVEKRVSKYLGDDVTNNQAEYHGLIEGMKAALQHEVTHLEIRGDSELIIKQVKGENRVQAPRLKPLHREVQNLGASFAGLLFYWIPREKNTEADQLANEAIDSA